MGVFGGSTGTGLFSIFYKMAGANVIFLDFLHRIYNWDFASGFLLIPRPEAEITKCLSRRGRFLGGLPKKLILGDSENRRFLGTPRFRGVGVEGWNSSLLVIYIGRGVWGSSSDKQVRRRISNAPPLPEAGAQHYRAGGER